MGFFGKLWYGSQEAHNAHIEAKVARIEARMEVRFHGGQARQHRPPTVSEVAAQFATPFDAEQEAFLAAWQYKMHSEFGDDRMLRSDEHDAARAYNASRHERRRLQGFQLVLGVEPVGESSNAFQDAVARLQRRAGVAADGRVNEHTEAALKALAEAMAKYATSYAAGVQVA